MWVAREWKLARRVASQNRYFATLSGNYSGLSVPG